MKALLDRSEQAISVTEVSRNAKIIFDRLSTGKQENYVVMRNNAPAVIMMPVSAYEALMDELDDMRIEMAARDRQASFDRTKSLTHEEILEQFGEDA